MLQEWIMKKSLSKSNMEKNVEGAAGRGIGLFCLYWNVAGYHSRYVPVDKGGKAELTGVRASRIGGVKQTLTWEWEVRHKKWETSNSSQLNLGQNFGRSYNKSWLVFCCPAAIVTYLTFLISQLSILSLIFFSFCFDLSWMWEWRQQYLVLKQILCFWCCLAFNYYNSSSFWNIEDLKSVLWFIMKSVGSFRAVVLIGSDFCKVMGKNLLWLLFAGLEQWVHIDTFGPLELHGDPVQVSRAS